jgi:DNA polymerase-3 subunit gamma/tau
MVRYLRNALMAKLGGEQTELLEISADERARAARTALLFTEEELTRNLQIVLRTFDDLNYRQEQRFHLELGLLKLIHAQRLLPIEELLSGVTGSAIHGVAAGSAARAGGSVSHPTNVRASAGTSAGREAAGWGSAPGVKLSAEAGADAGIRGSGAAYAPAMASGAAMREPAPFPAVASQAAGYSSPATLTEGALAKAPEAATATAGGLNIASIREAIVAALATAGHSSAAQLLGAGAWTLDGASVRVAAPGMGKKMLSLTVNAAAEKIIRHELQRLGAPARFLVSAGAGMAPAAVIAPPVAPAGSVQEAALAHPLVQRAREIFKAEVRSVVDLRHK